jgi:large subunit ribosomal protein L19
MAIQTKFKDVSFAVGDFVKVYQKVKEGDKTRLQVFEGMVIGIKGRAQDESFTIRRIGEAQVGIERIFPVNSPNIDKISLIKKGGQGVRHAKLYYTRNKSKREIDKIFKRTFKKTIKK